MTNATSTTTMTKRLTRVFSFLGILPGFLLGLMAGALGVLALIYLTASARKAAQGRPSPEQEPTRQTRSGTLEEWDVISVGGRQDTKCVN